MEKFLLWESSCSKKTLNTYGQGKSLITTIAIKIPINNSIMGLTGDFALCISVCIFSLEACVWFVGFGFFFLCYHFNSSALGHCREATAEQWKFGNINHESIIASAISSLPQLQIIFYIHAGSWKALQEYCSVCYPKIKWHSYRSQISLQIFTKALRW